MKTINKTICLLVCCLTLMVTKTFSTCSCGGGNDIGANNTSTNASTLTTPLTGTKCLHGTLIINVASFTFSSLNLQMDIDAEIVIISGNTLNIVSNSNLYSCDQIHMWNSITVESGSTIAINGNSTIQDAKYGITTGTSINPILLIEDVTFNKNYVGISISNGLSSSSYFKNVDIQCETGINSGVQSLLLDPHTTVRSSVGVYLENTPYFSFTSSSPDYTFNISFLDYGFSSFGSSYLLQNAIFSICENGVKILSPSVSSGIEISYNEFKGCQTGIYGSALNLRAVSIISNRFDFFVNNGIKLYQIVHSEIHIVDNYFNYDVNNNPIPYAFADEGTNGIYLSNPYLAWTEFEITINNLNNCRNCIDLQNIFYVPPPNLVTAVYLNHILLNEELTYLQNNNLKNSAIRVENCRNVGCESNFIDRLVEDSDAIYGGSDQDYIYGIKYTLSNNLITPLTFVNQLFFSCIVGNVTKRVSNSVFFSSYCPGIGVFCNTMHDAYYDISLGYYNQNTSAVIFDQPFHPWTTVSQQNTFDDVNCANQHWRVNGINAVNPSTNFYYNGGSFPSFWVPDVTYCTGISTAIGNNAYDMCPAIGTEIEKEPTRESLFGGIVRQEIEYSNDEYMYNKYAREYAFRFFVENNDWLDLNVEDDEMYINFFDEMYSSNAGLFLQAENRMSEENYEAANDILSTITPDDDMDSYKLTCYTIFCLNQLYEPDGYKPEDSTTLANIAYSNYFTAGEAVFIARAMLGLVIEDYFGDEFKLRPYKPTTKISALVKIHPNPASNYISVSFPITQEPVKYLFKVYDLLGKVMVEKYLISINNTIDITEIPVGLYYYSISGDKKTSLTDKILISR